MSSDIYLHITEFGDLELCSSDHLRNNILNGSLLVPRLLSLQKPYTIIDKAIRKYSAKYLLISADPFYLHTKYISYFSTLLIPIGLILSDSHHGDTPLTRIIQFCIGSRVQSVLLRFNQRHATIFRKIGIWSDSTIFSPDIAQYIRAVVPNTNHLYQAEVRTLHESSMSLMQATPPFLHKPGVFIGRHSRNHPFRYLQLKMLNMAGYTIDVCSTKGPVEMIDKIRSSSWALNLPLNGDFNRRFLEIILAGTPMVSEYIPKSQMVFPFSSILEHVTFVKFNATQYNMDRPELSFLGFNQQNHLSCSIEARRRLVHMFYSGYDQSILSSFISSLGQKSVSPFLQLSTEIIEAIKLYDILLEAHKDPQLTPPITLKILQKKHLFLDETIGIDSFDEFYRLTELIT